MGKFFRRETDIRKQKQKSLDYSQLKYDHLEMTCLECAKYNKLYHTNYSYGTYVAAKTRGWLEYSPPKIYNPPKYKRKDETLVLVTSDELSNNFGINIADFYGGNLVG